MGDAVAQQLVENRRPAQRSAAIDAVRVLGIVAVVAGHVFEGAFVLKGLFTWHVPVFFFLTGYLWTTNRSFVAEVGKRVRTLIAPYAAWLVLISVPFLTAMGLLGKLDASNLMPIILGGSYLGSPFSAFWFITALFVSSLTFRILRKGPPITQLATVILALALAATVGPTLAAVPLSVGVAIPCVAFLAAGAAARSYRPRIARPAPVAVILLVMSAVLIIAGISAPLDIKNGDFGTPVLSMLVAGGISFGLVLAAESILPNLGRVANKSVTTLALCGLMVVFTHAFVIWILRLATLSDWGVFAIALLAPWGAAVVVSRSRLSPLLVGSPYKPAPTP
nr:acyltransferase family protein [Arthrobacter sp. zg-Y769]